MKKITIIIAALLLTSCIENFPKSGDEKKELMDELMEAGYWLGQLDYHRGIIKLDTTTYQLKYSIYGKNKQPKFWYGDSYFGKLIQKRIESELNKNK